MIKQFLLIGGASIVSACGGGSGSTDFEYQTLAIFSDAAGIAKGKDGIGRELYYMAPNIVADVAASNEAGPQDPIDILDYPIIAQQAGYNIRQGAISGMNVLVVEKIGTERASMAYLYNDFEDALAVAADPLNNIPAGVLTYSGLYVVGLRGSNWNEIGDFNLTVDVDAQRFSLQGSSSDTLLTGSGFLEASTGSVSSSNLTFTDVDYGTYSATAIGTLGGNNANEVVGLWYTNESDSDPDFAGGFTGSR